MSGAPEDVVVSGLGLITAVGGNVEDCWTAIQEGRSGIRKATVVPAEHEVKLVGEVTIPLEDHRCVGADDAPVSTKDRCHEIAQLGASEAVEAAHLLDAGYDPERIGIVLGTSLGGQRLGEKFHRQWLAEGLESANGLLMLDYPLYSVLDNLAAEFDFRGPRCVQSNACAAGAVAIAFAVELLRSGDADAVLTGGVDPLAYLSFGGFQTLGALDEQPCAPYTRSSGTTLGEGGGFLVLERRAAAAARGATPLAVVAGYGLSADAYHATAPDPKGVGAATAMQQALKMAGLEPQDVNYINGHGTGTPANDSTEPKAIRTLFGEKPPPVSSTKSMVGHTLGAAGAVEAVVSILAIRDQVLPPTVVPDGVETTSGLDIVPGHARPAPVRAVVSNSFAFGGNNASLAIVAPDHPCLSRRPKGQSRSVVVTGVGALCGTAKDGSELVEALHSGTDLFNSGQLQVEGLEGLPKGEIPDQNTATRINPRYRRKMDGLERSAASAVSDLLSRRKISRSEASTTGVICATTGPVDSIATFEESLIRRGSGNAKVFPNTVMNAAAGYVALLNGFRGPTATHAGTGPAAVGALYLAHRLIASGQADRIVVLSTDEVPDAHLLGYSWIPGYLSAEGSHPFEGSGRLFGGASVAVLLEAEESADPSKILGRITGLGLSGGTCGAGRLDPDGVPWAQAFEIALAEAGCSVDDVDLFVSDACGVAGIDDVETRAREQIGLHAEVFAPKRYAGDTFACAPLIGLAYALGEPQTQENRTFLISSSEAGGLYGSLVVERV